MESMGTNGFHEYPWNPWAPMCSKGTIPWVPMTLRYVREVAPEYMGGLAKCGTTKFLSAFENMVNFNVEAGAWEWYIRNPREIVVQF
jgi:hypothetical protein